MSAQALFHYGWGVPAFVLAKIYAPAFFAREDTKAPMRYALTRWCSTSCSARRLFFGLRAAGRHWLSGLAIATSAAAWLNVLLMVRSPGAQRRLSANARGAARGSLRICAGLGDPVRRACGSAAANRAALEAQLGSKEVGDRWR